MTTRSPLVACPVTGCANLRRSSSEMCRTHQARLRRKGTVEMSFPALEPGVDVRVVPSLPEYVAGSDGHIYSLHLAHVRAPRLLREKPTHDGYLRVRVRRGGKNCHQAVAPFVAEAWIGVRPEGLQVRHINGIKTDNRPTNLEYGTALENAEDRERHGTTARGERSGVCRFTDVQVRWAIEECRNGRTATDVARELGTTQSAVSSWVRGKSRRLADVA